MAIDNKFANIFGGKERLVMLTAYNFYTARILDELGVDIILVGDSGVMVELGKNSTKDAQIDELITFTRAVKAGVKRTLIISDMPIHTYDTPARALENARRLLDAGADGVKVEGLAVPIVKALRKEKIEIMGHIGLTPQIVHEYKVQGKTEEDKVRLIKEAKELEKAGVFSLVLECIPSGLGRSITQEIGVPTIGIGAGPDCDGQVLVINDLLGMYKGFTPRFVRQYMDFDSVAKRAIQGFIDDVKSGDYPNQDESYDG